MQPLSGFTRRRIATLLSFSMKVITTSLLLILPAIAQQPASEETPAPIAPVEPVPLPDNEDLLDTSDLEITPPESVTLDFAEGFDFVRESQSLTSRGAIRAVGNNGMTLRADGGSYLGNIRQLNVRGAVKLTTPTGIEVFANRAVLDDAKKTITLSGNVSIYRQQQLQRGEHIIYHLDSGKFGTSDLRTSVAPLFLEAGAFTLEQRDGKDVYVGRNAGVTTHDSSDPAFWVRTSETAVYPGERVTFRNMTVRIHDVPVFWFPYYSQPLDPELGFKFVPGGRSNLGPFLLSRYGVMLGKGDDPWLLSRWKFDIRGQRGLAGGLDLVDRRLEDKEAFTGFSAYYANDLDPTISRSGNPRPPINHDRWNIRLQHRLELPFEDDNRWRIDANLNALSDNFFLEDFDREKFRTNPNPDNTLGLFRHGEHSLFGFMTRLDINDFYRSDSRLPEISFDQSRRPIFNTPILHQGRSSFSVIREQIGTLNQSLAQTILALPPGAPNLQRLLNRLPPLERQLVQQLRALPPGDPSIPALTNQLLNPEFVRFHTYQSLSLPQKIGGWLNFTPEVGAGYTHYADVNGPVQSEGRPILHAGAEASVKFSRHYDAIDNPKLGLQGLLHVVQPYARFSHLDTGELNPLFPLVDRETFSTRPRTLDPNRFNATDSLRDWTILRVGVRNQIITHRDGQSYEWLAMDTYIDRFWEDPQLNREFSNLYNDFTWNPLPWMGFDLETQFPVLSGGSGFSEVNARVRFMPNENVEFSIGNRFLNNHPILVDSIRLDIRGYARLNDKWGIGATHVWELDDGVLETQHYSIHRDFNYVTSALGFTINDNRVKSEYGVFLSFTLKDFPVVSVPLGIDTP